METATDDVSKEERDMGGHEATGDRYEKSRGETRKNEQKEWQQRRRSKYEMKENEYYLSIIYTRWEKELKELQNDS